jgi:hypothetical protein
MYRASLLCLLLCSAGLASVGCAHLPQPDGPHGPSARDALLLDPDAPRLIVEIDRIEGTNPRPIALRFLLQRLGLYTDKPGGISVVLDDVIPASEWQPDAASIRRLALKYRSISPKAPGPTHVEPSRANRAAVIHVLYAGSWKRYRGYTWQRGTMRSQSRRYDSPLIVVLQDRLRDIAWVTGAKQEGSVLIHEVGHAFGLASDPGHSSSGHCTNAQCLMYNGVDARTFFLYFWPTLFTGYLPLDFCGDCRNDLFEDYDGVPPGRRDRHGTGKTAGLPP